MSLQTALSDSVLVAETAESCEFTRLWVTEHHGARDIASSTPPVLLAHIANKTKRIRLGAGGVMLPNHQPLLVAEQFAALSALHPMRIDLAVGRATGAGPSVKDLLISDVESFSARLDQLARLLRPGRGTWPPPGLHLDSPPPLYVLSASLDGAALAAQKALALAFAYHLSPENAVPVIASYRERFERSDTSSPYVIVSVAFACAETRREARNILADFLATKMALKGIYQAASPQEASALLGAALGEAKAQMPLSFPEHFLVGDGTQVMEMIHRLLAATRADEVMLLPMSFDARLRAQMLRMLRAAGAHAGK
jgi:luciferase family oxidoreductase group 1